MSESSTLLAYRHAVNILIHLVMAQNGKHMLLNCPIQLFVALRAHLHFAAHFLCLACMQACLSQLYSFSSVFEYDVHQLDTSLPSRDAAVADACLGCK